MHYRKSETIPQVSNQIFQEIHRQSRNSQAGTREAPDTMEEAGLEMETVMALAYK